MIPKIKTSFCIENGVWVSCLATPHMVMLREQLVGKRGPDEVINDTVDGLDTPYMLRWWVKKDGPDEGYVYLHYFARSDYDRALHDHPRDNTSVLLEGEYLEHMQDGSVQHRAEGDIVIRRAADAHRIELVDGKPTWSLFLTGPKVREWGFYCKDGWTHNSLFDSSKC